MPIETRQHCLFRNEQNYCALCYTQRKRNENMLVRACGRILMEPADSQLRKLATRTDVIVAIITGLVIVITTALLVMLLF